jgi:hypothetical protein
MQITVSPKSANVYTVTDGDKSSSFGIYDDGKVRWRGTTYHHQEFSTHFPKGLNRTAAMNWAIQIIYQTDFSKDYTVIKEAAAKSIGKTARTRTVNLEKVF